MSDMGKIKEIELLPAADSAVFSVMTAKEYGEARRQEVIIEEDLLVPDTEPDMEQIFNVSAAAPGAGLVKEQDRGMVKGDLRVEALYRSTDGGKLLKLENVLPFKKEWPESFDDGAGFRIECEVLNVECRVINERKYRVKIRLDITVRELAVKERKIFEGIRDRSLELLKEDKCILSLASTAVKENEIDEELKINNEKIRPVRVIKSSFTVCENHRQLTSDKLVVNTTVWVRIIYMAELASQGNLANYPMYYTGKIDSTQFIPVDGGLQAGECRVNYDASDLSVEISDTVDGFRVKGFMKTSADIFESMHYDVVSDFYDLSEEMICDMVREQVCCGMEHITAQQVVKDNMDLHGEHWDTGKIVYTDTRITEYDIVVREGRAEISGKMQMEALVIDDDGRSVVARKMCGFEIPAEVPDDGEFGCCRIIAREIAADIAAGAVNFTVYLQVEADVFRYSSISLVSNPCFVRGENEKRYPLTVCTVAEGESLWDIAKRYRVPVEMIRRTNGITELKPGMKIIVAR